MRIFDAALTTEWLMYYPSLLGLRSFYKDAMAVKLDVGHLTVEELEQLWAEHEAEGLGALMHKTSTEDLSAMRARGVPIENTRYAYMREHGVAVINLIGPIYPRANMQTSSGAVSMEQWVMDLQRIHASDEVKDILIHADGPGGDARGVAAAARTVSQLAAKNTKKMVGFVSGWAASATYYVISPLHRIVADDWSSLGSIGVRVGVPNDTGDDVVEFVSDGADLKTASPVSDDGKVYYQERADKMGLLFRKDIAKYRAFAGKLKTADDVKALRGAVFLAKEAVEKGLADKVGTFEGTLHSLVTGRSNRTRQDSASAGGRDIIYIVSGDDIIRADDLASDDGEDDMGFSKKFQERMAKITSSKGRLAGEGAAQDDEEVDDVEETDDEASDGKGQKKSKVLTAAEQQARREELTLEFEDGVITFAENVVMESKATPAEAIDVAQEILDAKLDDAIYGGTVSFLDAENKEVTGTREQKVRAKYERKPKHSIATRRIAALKSGDTKGKILKERPKAETSGRDDEDEPDDDRVEKLLSMSSQGRNALREKEERHLRLADRTR